jgi:GNAT superfamily N-acetyltransferase
MTGFVIRTAIPDDTLQLVDLMRALAIFENYIDRFAVSADAVHKAGFGPNRTFTGIVAEDKNTQQLIGMAIIFVIPWTYTLRPRLVLKELYVHENARGRGVGHALMGSVKLYAKGIGADHIAWTVMLGNTVAEKFYTSLGGIPDKKWNNWILPVDVV